MRCLALAQAWQDEGGYATFAMAEFTQAIRDRIHIEGFDIAEIKAASGTEDDAKQTIKLARIRDARWLMVDGYAFGGEYQDFIKLQNLELLFVDDNGHANHYSADLVLNQNLHASSELYKRRAAHTQLLLGTSFAMLRREFDSWRGWRRSVAQLGRRVLIMMGGSDPHSATERVVRAVVQLPIDHLEIAVVIGGSNPNRSSLRASLAQYAPRVRVCDDPLNLPELMAWADLAISASGSTCWEMCFLGLPAVVIPVAENQRAAAKLLHACGAGKQHSFPIEAETLAEDIFELLSNYEKRRHMSRAAKRLVDGYGSSRVLESLKASVASEAGVP
jgi:UDP-2,4-diacetamido-2,4,6-trideoxy-beta-L-altropyranose hydrolase